MYKNFASILLSILAMLMLVSSGCKGRVEEISEVPPVETTQGQPSQEEMAELPMHGEEQQVVGTEQVPYMAGQQAQPVPEPAPVPSTLPSRNEDIQIALEKAGFYTGAIDGIIGPKTKKAIQDFQSAKGLKADGKVGPKTWAELQKYLNQ